MERPILRSMTVARGGLGDSIRATCLALTLSASLWTSSALAGPSLRDTLPAARAGNAGAQHVAGMMYLFGDGTRQDIP